MTFDSASKTMGRQPIELVNIETDSCSLSFGAGDCPATGDSPCYNTWATCPVKIAYVNTVKTYRFARSNAALPVGYSCLPLLQSVQYAPQVLTPAKGLGVRAAVTVRLTDTEWPDTADDPYFDQRPTGTEGQGTFFGRLRARNPFMFGRFLHVKTGYIVEGVLDESNLQTRSYIIESVTGADRSGAVTFVAKDVLKLADDDKAQCPRVTSARLDADITDVQTTLAMYPSGVGNAEFPASGVLRIASELMTFTRVGDVFTVSRGQYSTQAKAAKADDAIQLCAVFVNQPVQNLIYDLLVNYAKIPAAYIDKPAWDAERDAHLLGVYSSVITDPVGVNTLISELSEQGQCYVWWDDVARLIRFKALTAPPSDLPILSDEDHFLNGSISAGEATADRVSRFMIRFDRIDPTKKLDDVANFRQRWVPVDLQSEGEREYRSAKTRIINSRWFNSGSLGRVQQLGAALLSRYRDPPLTFEADIDISAGIKTGDLFQVSSRLFQNAAGSRKAISMQIVESYEKTAGSVLRLKSSELVWTGSDVPDNPMIIINTDLFDVDLLTLYQSEYGTPQAGKSVTFVVNDGVLIASTSAYMPEQNTDGDGTSGIVFASTPEICAITTNVWPSDVDVYIVVRSGGAIVGRGGAPVAHEFVIQSSLDADLGPFDGFAGAPAINIQHDRVHLVVDVGGLVACGGSSGGRGGHNVPSSFAGAGGGGAPYGRMDVLDPNDIYESFVAPLDGHRSTAGTGRTPTDHSHNGGKGGDGGAYGQRGTAGADSTYAGGQAGPLRPAYIGIAPASIVNNGQILGA